MTKTFATMGGEATAMSEPLTATSSEPRLIWRSVMTVAHGDGQALSNAIKARRPVVVRDLASSWPALTRWTREELSARYGEHRVPVYDASFADPGSDYMSNKGFMSLAEFLDLSQSQGRDLRMFLYNLAQKIPAMLDDIDFPTVGLKFSRRFVFSFFGCQGSTTPLHFDIDMNDVLHTAIQGRRRIRLFPPASSPALYRHPFTVRSYVDLDEPDFERFPFLAAAEAYEVVLQPGQTLYMPSGWWHEFHYLDAGIGVSLRAASPKWRDKARGLGNLVVDTLVDRLANRIAPRRWFAWKARHAQQVAQTWGRAATRVNKHHGNVTDEN